jgi:hypothetical protein
MSLNQASKGFKNQGQFIAALHVSQNLGIPFADLKTAMTGIRPVTRTPGSTTTSTGTHVTQPTADTPTLSLGQAIKKLRPGTNATVAASGAERQAIADLQIAPVPTSTTTTNTTTAPTTTTIPTTTTTSTTTSKRKTGK